MKRRRVTALLPPEIYERLERWAERDDRGVEQQAAHVIRQVILADRDVRADWHALPTGDES